MSNSLVGGAIQKIKVIAYIPHIFTLMRVAYWNNLYSTTVLDVKFCDHYEMSFDIWDFVFGLLLICHWASFVMQIQQPCSSS